MDPDELLRILRSAVADFRQASQDEEDDDALDAGQVLCERFADLDGWISGQGFLPEDWNQPGLRHK